MDMVSAWGTGLLVGLGLAAPLGAIGTLIVQEGMSAGWRRAAPAVAAVASVDTVYCVVIVCIGTVAQPTLDGLGPWPRAVAGVALLGVATWNLHRVSARTVPSTASPSGHDGWRRFLLFLGLTAINPATAIYFLAVVSGLAALADSAASAAAFVLGVGVASFGWHAGLVGLGALVGTRTGPRFRRLSTIVGSVVVATLGVGMLAGLG